MPPSFFSLKLLILHIFHPAAAVGELVPRRPPARPRAPTRKCPGASINNLSRPGVDDGLWCVVAPLTARMSMAFGFMMGDSYAGGPHPHPGRLRRHSLPIAETDPDPYDLNSRG
jgi:hypothetical protein